MEWAAAPCAACYVENGLIVDSHHQATPLVTVVKTNIVVSSNMCGMPSTNSCIDDFHCQRTFGGNGKN